MCDRVGVMARGRLVAEGPPGTLRGAATRHRIEVDDPARAARGRAGALPGVTAEAAPGGVLVRLADGADRRRRERGARRRRHPACAHWCRSATRWRTRSSRSWRAPMYRVELAKAARRWRTWLLAAALGGDPRRHDDRAEALAAARRRRRGRAAVPAADPRQRPVRAAHGARGDAAVLPAARRPGCSAGDAIAGEAQAGTLRYLLVRPVRRSRLVLAKYASSMTLVAGAGGRRDRVRARGRRRRLRVGARCRRCRARRCRSAPRCCGSSPPPPTWCSAYQRHRGHRAVHLHAHRLRPGGDGGDDRARHREPDPRQHPEPAGDPPVSCPPTGGWRSPTCSGSRSSGAAMRGGLLVSAATRVFLGRALWRFERRDVTRRDVVA